MPNICQEYSFFLSIFLKIFVNIKKNLSGYFSNAEYLQKAQNFSDHFQPVNYVFVIFLRDLKKSDANF